MNVFTATELASKTKTVCDVAQKQGCAFVTNNGKLDYMLVDISMFDTLNDAVRSYDKWRMQHQLERIWSQNASSDITFDDIEAEIQAVRASARA